MSKVEFKIPEQLNFHSVSKFSAAIFNTLKAKKPSAFVLDFCPLTFIDAAGITTLANMTMHLFDVLPGVSYKIPTNDESVSEPLRFLDDSGFFKNFIGESIFPNSQPRRTTIPLRHLRYEEYHNWLENTVVPWIDSQIDANIKQQMPEFSVCMDEIFNNVNDHSKKGGACVFMQHYPRSKQIQIAISDFGVGIPLKVREYLNKPIMKDDEAILKAMENGFSTKSTPRNRGYGLDNLLKNVVDNNKGSMFILSGRGSVYCALGQEPVGTLPNYAYPGTLINIYLKTDTLLDIQEVPEEFEW